VDFLTLDADAPTVRDGYRFIVKGVCGEFKPLFSLLTA
jgi:hypothetical protein